MTPREAFCRFSSICTLSSGSFRRSLTSLSDSFSFSISRPTWMLSVCSAVEPSRPCARGSPWPTDSGSTLDDHPASASLLSLCRAAFTVSSSSSRFSSILSDLGGLHDDRLNAEMAIRLLVPMRTRLVLSSFSLHLLLISMVDLLSLCVALVF